jgi:ATP-dependent DNA helicase RecG
MSSSVKSRPRAGRKQRANGARKSLSASIRSLPGVGTRREDLLRELGVSTVGDLLVYPPRRYIDRTSFSRIADLEDGAVQTVSGTVTGIEARPAGHKRLFIAHIRDDSGRMRCVWFNQAYLRNVFRPGDAFVFSGRGKVDGFDRSMVHPEYEKMEGDLLHTGRVVPVYGTRPGLGQKQLRKLARHALDAHLGDVQDCMPASTRRRLGLAPLAQALEHLHFPPDLKRAEQARRRLAFDEVLVFQTLFALARRDRKQDDRDRARPGDEIERLTAHLPYTLTGSQTEALETLICDIRSPYPMRRLLQGDVGCGKTVVACLAAALVCEDGGQTALMCPTELLAEQHHRTLSRFMAGFGFRVGLLTGSVEPEEARQLKADLKSGALPIVVGTHALITESTAFGKLELAIVDEEQRFGVLQRARFLEKAPCANALVISATPIPRTLALTAYGDLDVTVIDEMPPGRGGHMTRCLGEEARTALLRDIGRRVATGAQGFYVCPAVERSEAGLMDVGTARKLVQRYLGAGRRAEILTGRTPPEDRYRIIEDFRRGSIGLIVATTVIEVGMDIPAATILVVDQADRFGLSQLHQMRGRVARTGAESLSFLIVSESASDRARERVEVLQATFDGFEIAERDLTFRGPGDVIGTRQHGIPDLSFACLPEDTDLMLAAREEAFERVLGGDDSEEWQGWIHAVRSLTAGLIKVV